MEVRAQRPLPVWDSDTEEYWRGAARHVLLVQRCRQCGQVGFPPYPVCRTCNVATPGWVESVGTGTIYTWTIVYRSTRAEFVDEVPYPLVVVELDDYPVRIPGRLKGAGAVVPRIGARVCVRFEDVTSDVTLPYWELLTELPLIGAKDSEPIAS